MMATSSHRTDYQHNDAIVDVLQGLGRELVVSYPTITQFNDRLSSGSYGLAAVNFASVFFELTHHHEGSMIDVLRVITCRDTIENTISAACSANNLHLDVEDILRVPLFSKSLNHVLTYHDTPNAEYFTRILQVMRSLRSSATVIISCPPEVIACAKISGLQLDVFMIFDFYPRPSYPSGTCLILSTSIHQVVLRLLSALPIVDESFLSEDGSRSQTSHPNVSSRIFVSNGLQDVRQSAIESGLAVLRLQTEIADLKQENKIPDSEEVVEPESQHSFENDAAAPSASHNFSCAICMDEHPVDNNVDLDCDHTICRDCTRGHVCAKIEEHRFPVLCPVCMMEQNDQPAVISGLAVQLIGIDERQYTIWEEMELSQHSILIHCRQCERSVLVDKQEHEASRTLICPLPNCNHSWCKACQHPVTAGDPTHSCDGATELDALMRQQGWKYCPNCRTPVERNGGCRHMTCIAPGCNTHFCYACGEQIIRSALQNEIQGAVTTHYSGACQMFDGNYGEDAEPGDVDFAEGPEAVDYAEEPEGTDYAEEPEGTDYAEEPEGTDFTDGPEAVDYEEPEGPGTDYAEEPADVEHADEYVDSVDDGVEDSESTDDDDDDDDEGIGAYQSAEDDHGVDGGEERDAEETDDVDENENDEYNKNDEEIQVEDGGDQSDQYDYSGDNEEDNGEGVEDVEDADDSDRDDQDEDENVEDENVEDENENVEDGDGEDGDGEDGDVEDEDEDVEDEAVEDEDVEDEVVEDEDVEDEAVEDEDVEDEDVEDEDGEVGDVEDDQYEDGQNDVEDFESDDYGGDEVYGDSDNYDCNYDY